jgi:hypothetical protein
MNGLRQVPGFFLVCVLSFLLYSLPALPQTAQDPAETGSRGNVTARDGQHDFDFEFGTWKTHISRLQHPLTGSTTWVEYDGTSVVRKIWNGRGNLGELEVAGSAGRIEGLSLRLYNPQSRQWSIYGANSNDGALGQAMVGEFKNGCGEFFDQEPLNGRSIIVRFIFSEITSNSFRLEQAFSEDGAKTWEVNWIATFVRMKDDSRGAAGPAAVHQCG